MGSHQQDGPRLFSATQQQDKGQQSQIEVPSKYEEKLLYCDDDRALEEVGQRSCEISFSGGTQNSPGCDSVQPAPGEPALAGDLG